MKDALYAKAKVVAAVEKANLNSSSELDDMISRMLQKTEYTLEEVSDQSFQLLNSKIMIDQTLLFALNAGEIDYYMML